MEYFIISIFDYFFKSTLSTVSSNFVNHTYLLENHNLSRGAQQFVTKLIRIQDVLSVIHFLQNMTG